MFEPVCLDARLPADHQARTIWRVVERLDLSAFYDGIAARGSEPGRAATDPKLLVALWLYAAVDGVGNGRKLDRLCREHDAYKWLCGGVSLNYHTLNDFRVAHEKSLDGLFTEVLTALTERGVVRIDRISQDGKRVRASAGSSSFHCEKTLRRRLKEVRAYVEELKRQPDEAPGELRSAAEGQGRSAGDGQPLGYSGHDSLAQADADRRGERDLQTTGADLGAPQRGISGTARIAFIRGSRIAPSALRGAVDGVGVQRDPLRREPGDVTNGEVGVATSVAKPPHVRTRRLREAVKRSRATHRQIPTTGSKQTTSPKLPASVRPKDSQARPPRRT